MPGYGRAAHMNDSNSKTNIYYYSYKHIITLVTGISLY